MTDTALTIKLHALTKSTAKCSHVNAFLSFPVHKELPVSGLISPQVSFTCQGIGREQLLTTITFCESCATSDMRMKFNKHIIIP